MISVRQIKAARALLGWSQEDLARESAVSYPTIARLETADGELGGRPETAEKIIRALEGGGIEFTNGGQPGVKIVKGWYTELYDENSTRAKSSSMLKDFAAVRSLIMSVRKEKTGEIVRVSPPLDASRADLDDLEQLGAKRF